MRHSAMLLSCFFIILQHHLLSISATSTHSDIAILPANDNKTIFEDGNFRRTCRYTGSVNVSQLHILHNGEVVDTVSDANHIMLDVDPAELGDAGTYSCQVVFTDSSNITADMGTLTVVGLHLVSAPWEQYVVEGEDITLQCSFSNPDNVYGRVITTIRRGGQTTPVITGATIGDEGEYRCEISLIDHSDSTQVSITLHVFTPINITNSPQAFQTLYGVQEATFVVQFNGRASQGLYIQWFKRGIEQFDQPNRRIINQYNEETRTGNTSIHFPEMDRDDNDVYRVLITTDFGEEDIPLGPRRAEVSFQIEVKVPPPEPTEFIAEVTEHQANLQWELPITHQNQNADTFDLKVSFPNGSTAYSETLEGSATTAVISVIPGVSYSATLTANNGDGQSQNTLTFQTPPAAPYVTFFEARRLNETHFNISISLLYTGGGEITKFSVYFREQHTISWSERPVMIVELPSYLALDYQGVISGEEIKGKGPLEFELRVENGLGFMNRTGSGLEISDPPGPPTKPVIASTSDTSVVLDFKLPEEGTPPFINIILEFSEPRVMNINYTGSYKPGETVVKEVMDLSPSTAYSLKARAVNYAGNGPSSDTLQFMTNNASPTTPTIATTSNTTSPTPSAALMWPIIGGVGGALCLILLIAVTVSIISCYCGCRRRKNQNVYKVDKTVQGRQERDVETGEDTEKEMKEHQSQRTSSSAASSMEKLQQSRNTQGNIYLPVPQHDRKEKVSSAILGNTSPSSNKWRMERSPNQASSSTLNSGGSATQDSFKKPYLPSTTDSEIQLSSLQSSQPSQRTSRDSFGYYRRGKVANPSISSGGSETTTETADRYHTTNSFLTPSIGEYSSSQTIPFIPQGVSYTSLPYSDHTQTTNTQYSMDQPQSQCTNV